MKLKSYAIPLALLGIKVLTVARTGIDTYRVTNDILDVLLIDGVMAAFWLVAAYAGQSQQALAVRPFAAAGAWALYGAQLYIGWEAGHSAIAFIVRGAGGLALLYDTWGYVVALFQRRGRPRNLTPAQRRAAIRRAISGTAYYVMALALAPLSIVTIGVHVLADMVRDMMTMQYDNVRTDGDKHRDIVRTHSDIVTTDDDSVMSAPRHGMTVTERRSDMAARMSDTTMTMSELASLYGVSPRTIARDMAVIAGRRG